MGSDGDSLPTPEARHDTSLLAASLAGAAAGLISDGFTHPIDTIRTLLLASEKGKYTSSVDCLRQTLRKSGPTGLYRGFATVATLTVPAHALYFGSYDMGKTFLIGRGWDPDSGLMHAISGLVADVFGAFIWTPQDVIKQRMQYSGTSSVHYATLRSSIRHIVATEGVTALWKGNVAAIMTYGPFASLYFMFYEKYKKNMIQRLQGTGWLLKDPKTQQEALLPLWMLIVGGALTGGTVAGLTTPLDVVKTRIQVGKAADHLGKTSGMLPTLRHMIKTEGMGVLVRGIGPRVLWISCNTSVGIAAFDVLKRNIRQLQDS